MKIKNIITLIVVIAMTAISCSNEDLVELNENPNGLTEIDFQYMLTRAQLQFSTSHGTMIRSNLIYCSNMIQHNSDVLGFTHGDKYFYDAGYSSSLWGQYYGQAIKQLSHVLNELTIAENTNSNLYAITLASRCYAMHRITDMYGDLPYHDAGNALLGEDHWYPVYDSQQSIYQALVEDLREARGILNASGDNLGVQDVIYNGDTDNWKKFINSMLLRIGMRMSNVDPATAKSVVEEAVASGVFTSNLHEAFIKHSDGTGINTNGTSTALTQGETYAVELRPSVTFVEWMKNGNDPRLMIICGGVGDPFGDASAWDTNPANQVGQPNGYDGATIGAHAVEAGLIANPEDWTQHIYSFINTELMDREDPYYIVRHAEVKLLLAEAALNGWNVGGTAQEYFEAGIRASMKNWEGYGVPAVPIADVDAYIAGLDFGNASETDQYRLIGEQFWAATYLNHEEAWYNWRRTGYPQLTPVDYPGNVTGGEIPRRMRYPENEAIINGENYDAAVARQGADDFNTRVWWDKE